MKQPFIWFWMHAKPAICAFLFGMCFVHACALFFFSLHLTWIYGKRIVYMLCASFFACRQCKFVAKWWQVVTLADKKIKLKIWFSHRGTKCARCTVFDFTAFAIVLLLLLVWEKTFSSDFSMVWTISTVCRVESGLQTARQLMWLLLSWHSVRKISNIIMCYHTQNPLSMLICARCCIFFSSLL